MILQKIKIHNFKSIYGDFEMNFEDVKGFWKIEGSVGSGKTTIGEAIIFGLFGDIKGKNQRDLISWGEKKGWVEIECVSNGKHLCIHRNISGELSVLVEGAPLVFTNKRDAQSQLADEYYDVSKMTLELLCIISFNNFKSLSNMTPSDSRAFLDQVFGFSLLSQYAEDCKEQKKEVENNIAETNSELKSILAQIHKIEELSNQETIEGNLNEVNLQIVENQKVIKEQQEKISQFEKEQHAIIREKQDELIHIKELGLNKAKEIKFIEKGICPTCGAKIDQSELETKRKEREVFLMRYNDINNEISNLTDKLNKSLLEMKNELSSLNESHRALIRLQTQLKEQQKRLSINKNEIGILKKQKNTIEQQINELNDDKMQWDQLFDFVSTDMRQKVLSSFIPLLNNAIQNYARQLNLPYIIEFDNQFKCFIRLFGLDKPISISMLSTGQLKTVDMCIILGVLKVIFNGIHFNVMFLDELFSNMDPDLRSMVCSVLKKELKENQTIFIISHQELFDTNFDGTISAKLSYSDSKEKSLYEVKKS